MIAHVSGVVVEKFANSLIIDVGGLGYEVLVAAGDYDAHLLDQTVKLYTHDHIRENIHELFGFSSLAGKKLFELLIGVQGIGPKAALAILSLGQAEAVRSAIASGDSAFIQRASGIGKKSAERVVVDLQDKVGMPGASPTASLLPAHNDDALDALMALGYNLAQATSALDGIDASLDPQTRIKQALRKIGG